MNAHKTARMAIVLVLGLLLRPGFAWAQGASSGAIAGVARDSSGLAVIPRYGASFLRPSATHGARMVKFGVQFDY